MFDFSLNKHQKGYKYPKKISNLTLMPLIPRASPNFFLTGGSIP